MSKKVLLTEAVPDINDFWDEANNNGRRPEEFGASSMSDIIWTLCPVCRVSKSAKVRNSWHKDSSGIGHVNRCKKCRKLNEDCSNSLAVNFPGTPDDWDEERNGSMSNYTVGSGKYVYVRCPECKEFQYRAVADTVQQNKDGSYRLALCRSCSYLPKYISKQNRKNTVTETILDCYSNIVKFWSYSINDKKPEEVLRSSKEYVTVHCPSCNRLVERRACNVLLRSDNGWIVSKCHTCGNTDARASKTSLIEMCPDVENWWDYDKNTKSPAEVPSNSHKDAYFKCPECRRSFLKRINHFVTLKQDGKYHTGTCQNCGYPPKENPKDNLLVVCPEIENWWNYDKNYPARPEQFTKGSQFDAYLTCPDCGMELYTGIHSLVKTLDDGTVVIRHEGMCRKYLAQRNPNNILKKYPEAVKWWDKIKNFPNNVEDFTIYASEKAYFTCPDCGHTRYERISEFFRRNADGDLRLFDCPLCNGRTVPGVNSLKALYPEIAAECVSDVDTDRVNPNAFNSLDWKCPDCNNIYPAVVALRTQKGNACPYCDERRALPGFNDLATTHTELAKEWSPSNDRDVTTVLKSTKVPFKWICPDCNGEYSFNVADREVGDNACPYCDYRKVFPGYNSFKVIHPDIMEEFIEAANILARVDADNNLPNSDQKAWWKCSICGYEYMMPFKVRSLKKRRGHNPCPKCNGRRQISPYFFNVK